MTTGKTVDAAFLERRRRLALRASAIALVVAVVAFPIGMAIGDAGSSDNDTIAGMFMFAAIIGAVASPWIVRAWQSFMRRKMVAAAVAGRPDIRHVDGEKDYAGRTAALQSDTFDLAAFQVSGLVEAFVSAGADHILTGEAHGVPFVLAEMTLLDEKGYRMFRGVLASFRLARARPGLTIVARDRGLLGNLIVRAGSTIERLPLEDPAFEGVFEVYGTDQVGGRVVLTTTMLERLKRLDEVAHARGFACAFRGDRLLIAWSGMTWKCPAWRILRPLDSWLDRYAAWLAGLVDLPVEIAHTLNLGAPPADAAPPVPATMGASVAINGGSGGEVFSGGLARFVGEGGTALTYVASGSIFGGVAFAAARYGLSEGFPAPLFWYLWIVVSAGLIYGAGAISVGVRDLARLAWRWNSPLRTLKGP